MQGVVDREIGDRRGQSDSGLAGCGRGAAAGRREEHLDEAKFHVRRRERTPPDGRESAMPSTGDNPRVSHVQSLGGRTVAEK